MFYVIFNFIVQNGRTNQRNGPTPGAFNQRTADMFVWSAHILVYSVTRYDDKHLPDMRKYVLIMSSVFGSTHEDLEGCGQVTAVEIKLYI
jgi:hypothetical protein